MPIIAMAPIHGNVTWLNWRQSRPAGCSSTFDLVSGSVPRPSMRLSCCSSCCSCTAFAVGLTGCWACTGVAVATMHASARTPARNRICLRSVPMFTAPIMLRRNRFAICRPPSPGAGAIAALDYPLLVDLGDDLAVAGQERFGRAHLRAQRQLAFGQTIGAVFRVLRLRAVRLRSARAIRALVHLAAGAEVADARILRCAERAGVEAIAAADAEVLGMQHDRVGGGVEAIDRADRGTRRVGAMHAGHCHRTLAGLAVINGHDAPAVDAPRHVMLVLAGGDASVALDATVGVAEEFHPSHCRASLTLP